MAFPTQSVGLVKASNQWLSRAKTGSSNLYASGAQNWTFETWVKFTTLPSNSQVSLYGQSWLTGGNLSFLLQVDDASGTKGMRARLSSSGNQDYNAVFATFGGGLSTATWYHMGVVYTASSGVLELFLNGVSQGTASSGVTSIFNGTDPVSVGAEGDGTSSNLNGRMVMTRFWKATRTGSQLLTNQCTTLGAQTNLGAEWTLDNTLNDNSGNSNTLTNNNTATFTTDVPATCAIVGPTSVKTWDAVTQSTGIKVYEGVALASVKSVIGVT